MELFQINYIAISVENISLYASLEHVIHDGNE